MTDLLLNELIKDTAQARVATGAASVQPVVPSVMSVANGVPMDLKQMRRYLQGHDGVPVVLRERGTVHITCPYCGELHEHESSGHQVAGCDDNVLYGIGIFVGERYFVPNWGYHVYEYKVGDDGVFMLYN